MLRSVVITSLAIALVLVAVRAGGPASGGEQVYGDATCDGTTNSIDATVILQYAAELLPSVGCPENADVNRDIHVGSLDSALILQFVAGLLSSLEPGITPTPEETPQLCPDGYYWNPNKGHCDSRECPPGFVFNKETLYCELAPTATPAA